MFGYFSKIYQNRRAFIYWKVCNVSKLCATLYLQSNGLYQIWWNLEYRSFRAMVDNNVSAQFSRLMFCNYGQDIDTCSCNISAEKDMDNRKYLNSSRQTRRRGYTTCCNSAASLLEVCNLFIRVNADKIEHKTAPCCHSHIVTLC